MAGRGAGPITIAGSFNLSNAGLVTLTSSGTVTETAGSAILDAWRCPAAPPASHFGGANQIGRLAGFTTTGAFALTDVTAAWTWPARSRQGGGIALTTGDAADRHRRHPAQPAVHPGRGDAGQQRQRSRSRTAAIQAATLTGSAGSVALSGVNTIGTLGSFTTTGGFALTDASSLDIAGTVSAGGGIALTTAGLRVGTGFTQPGVLSTPGAITLVSSGAISEPNGAIQAATLTGSAASLALTTLNTIGTLNSFTTTGGFALTDASSLDVVGHGFRRAATIALNTGGLRLGTGFAQPGRISHSGRCHAGSAAVAISEPNGAILAATLSGSAPSAALTAPNTIGTLGSFTTSGDFALVDLVSLTVSGPVSTGTGPGATPGVGSLSLSSGGNIQFAGNVFTNLLQITSGGTVVQAGGSLVLAGTLTGSAVHLASFGDTGGTALVSTLGAFTVSGSTFILRDSETADGQRTADVRDHRPERARADRLGGRADQHRQCRDHRHLRRDACRQRIPVPDRHD